MLVMLFVGTLEEKPKHLLNSELFAIDDDRMVRVQKEMFILKVDFWIGTFHGCLTPSQN